MNWMRTAGVLLLSAVLLSACSVPAFRSGGRVGSPGDPPIAAGTEPEKNPRPSSKPPGNQEGSVRFALYTGPLGFRLPENRRDLAPGDSAIIGTASVDLDVLAPDLGEGALRQALTVEGASLASDPRWSMDRGLSLRLNPGKAGDTVIVRVKPPGLAPAVLTLRRAAPAKVSVDYRYADEWRPVTVLGSHLPPGPAEIKLTFSKPVRRQEVEKALAEAQPAPIRGLMQWPDDQTLIWAVAELPPRVDLLLGSSHDQDGLPLPGGIPSLRVGDPPTLVAADLGGLADRPLAVLPPDLLSAQITADRKAVNLVVWTPGTTRWDWQTTDLVVDLATGTLKSGRVEGVQPRLTGELENWLVNPGATLVAGFRPGTEATPAQPGARDMVVRDLRGGREQVFRGFALQAGAPGTGAFLAWSADGLKVAALSDRPGSPGSADLVVADIPTQQRRVLVQALPVAAVGTRLAWSPDGRYLLAGHLLVDLSTGQPQVLPGDPGTARGAWEPGGNRLLYSTRDWEALFLFDPTAGEPFPLGRGFLVDWEAQGKPLVIRWTASNSRYVPPGQ